jgi:putative transposase
MLDEGSDLSDMLKQLEIAESTWNRWRSQFGGVKADGAKKLKLLEFENTRLKKLLAEAGLDKAMLTEVG